MDSFKMDLGDIGWDGMDGIGLAQDREDREDSFECGNESSGSLQCWETSEWLQGGLSSSDQLHRLS
jgi:hypothetical protein